MSNDTNTGVVKWFNNKAGYGFVTILKGPYSGKDVFVHHSAILTKTEQFKYLVQGEYIDCVIEKSNNDKHDFVISKVNGILNGKLMCETRYENKSRDKN
jgi:cold shock CspA family protein